MSVGRDMPSVPYSFPEVKLTTARKVSWSTSCALHTSPTVLSAKPRGIPNRPRTGIRELFSLTMSRIKSVDL